MQKISISIPSTSLIPASERAARGHALSEKGKAHFTHTDLKDGHVRDSCSELFYSLCAPPAPADTSPESPGAAPAPGPFPRRLPPRGQTAPERHSSRQRSAPTVRATARPSTATRGALLPAVVKR